jgi:hypothetical protein
MTGLILAVIGLELVIIGTGGSISAHLKRIADVIEGKGK